MHSILQCDLIAILLWQSMCITIGPNINIGIIFYCIGYSQWCIYNIQSESDWLFNTLSRVLQADMLILENFNHHDLARGFPHCIECKGFALTVEQPEYVLIVRVCTASQLWPLHINSHSIAQNRVAVNTIYDSHWHMFKYWAIWLSLHPKE